MTPPRICYGRLRGYKYRTLQEHRHEIPSLVGAYSGRNLAIEPSGPGSAWLVISAGYAWDGPSGPTIDTKSFMRGSLIHDALYQLLRHGVLPENHRKMADDELWRICRADGMNRFRAWYVRKMVRWLASRAAARTDRAEIQDGVFWAP